MEEANESAIITTSTNWIVADGSVADSVSFETSAYDSDAAAPKGLLLRRPPPPPDGDDPSPCEITINFSGKHEIHRVYVRSTARIYELYYASDHPNNCMEYLCTVRCGAVTEEVTPPLVTEGANRCQENSKGTSTLQEQVSRSNSSSSDEDGWVQIKVPDSSYQNNRKNTQPKSTNGVTDSQIMQNHYEATAEISDASPCVSLTLRLLSIQTKACVHVEEIYIYADPVESTNFDPRKTMTESSGGSSLLAMLVPSLMQLSKSRDSRVQEKSSCDERGSLKYQGERKSAQIISLNMEGQEACSSCMSPDQSLGSVQEPIEVNSEKIQLETSQKVPESNQIPNSSIDQHVNSGCDRLEKLLHELISRVGRVEAFCSRFEENMMKPLSCMDTRLQQVECKLDALAARSQCSEQFPPRVSSPEGLHEESDSVSRLSNTESKEAREDTTADTVLPTDGIASLSAEYETRPGLIFKAPDFSVDDDDCVDTDSTLDTLKDPPAKDKVLSIDAMLTSSLAAFLTSNTVISPNTTSSLRESSQASIDVTKRALDISKDVVLEDDESNMSDAKRKGICSDESKLVVDYAAAPGEKFSESDTKNRACDSLNTSREDTTLDASLLVINRDVECPVSSFQYSCGLKVVAPEYPKEGESSKVDTTSHLVESNMLPHKVHSEVNKENDMKVEVYLDQIRNILPRKVRCEKREHDDGKWKYSTLDVEACDGGCGSNCSAHEGVMTQRGCDVTLNEQQQAHIIDGVVTQNLTGSSADIGLTRGATQKRLCESIIKSTNDDSSISSLDEIFPEDKADSERSVGGRTRSFRGGFTTYFASFSDSDSEQSIALSGLVSNWVDDCSCNSSVDEHFLKNKFDILQLDSSIDSSGGDFRTVDHSKWQAAGSDYGSVLPVMAGENNIINHNHSAANECQSRESCNEEKSKANLEQELSRSMLDFDDLYNLKFAPGKYWAGLPLEVLLGEMSDTNAQAAAGESGEDDCTKNGQQQEELSSSGGTNCKAHADSRLLVDLEGPTLLTEDEIKAFNNLPLFTDFPDFI